MAGVDLSKLEDLQLVILRMMIGAKALNLLLKNFPHDTLEEMEMIKGVAKECFKLVDAELERRKSINADFTAGPDHDRGPSYPIH